MNKIVGGLVFAVACVTGAGSASAAGSIVAEANGARAEERWGGELGVGYSIGIAGFHLTGMGGAFIYKGDNDRYYEDANGGNERCRDSSNGQYTKDSKCSNVAAKAYGRIEATYTIPLIATIGAGARISSKVRPYGTVAVPLAPLFSLKANGGPHYAAVGLQVGF
jgi:hypothetical protein